MKISDLKSKQYFQLILPELEQLVVGLGELEKEYPEPLTRLVAFFNLTSPWQDRLEELRNKLRFKSSVVILKFRALFQFFESAGRNEYSMNRSMKGYFVTDQHVFLGNAFGIKHEYSVKNLFHCQNHPRNNELGGLDFPTPVNNYDVACNFIALPFISRHMRIIEVISDLKKEIIG